MIRTHAHAHAPRPQACNCHEDIMQQSRSQPATTPEQTDLGLCALSATKAVDLLMRRASRMAIQLWLRLLLVGL
ncbi:hypothetical protein [Paracoccus aminovorans]|uniref:hypothetical protein n=1 Tax=Paracoccus aminovorans TaxID=34004 RepID=UPI002B25B1B3|nr:hypothetical protein [Paracoccus aminovorans]